MNKTIKTMLLLALAAVGLGTLNSCKDDDDSTMSRLFRPVLSNSNIISGLDGNKVPFLELKWDAFADANQYVAVLVPSNGGEPITITTPETTCRFENLAYDSEYVIKLKSVNTSRSLESKFYETNVTTADYPTMLNNFTSSTIIDTQVKATWDTHFGETRYDQLKLFKESTDELLQEITVTEEALAAGEIFISNLEPKTTYRLEAYYQGKYLGKKRFTTAAPENYDGYVFDMRGMEDKESERFISTETLDSLVSHNPGTDITIVLKGGMAYKISGGTTIPAMANKIKFVTGLSLSGNATFISTGGMTIGKDGADVKEIVFEKIDFISDKANAMESLYDNTDKGWGGRQVFNINGVKSTLESLTFKNCTITGYRAVVRGQTVNDHIHNIKMEDCVINAIGDQGVFTNADKGGDWRNVSLKNCTFTNIVMLCDFRKTVNPLEMNVENCTFCYAPMETNANANTPLFRFGANPVTLNVKNTLFGPSMASEESAGGSILPYRAGVIGSVLVNASALTPLVTNSYKTNFIYTDFGTEEASKTYPLEGLETLNMSESQLWGNPSSGNFKIIVTLDATNVGDNRWN